MAVVVLAGVAFSADAVVRKEKNVPPLNVEKSGSLCELRPLLNVNRIKRIINAFSGTSGQSIERGKARGPR